MSRGLVLQSTLKNRRGPAVPALLLGLLPLACSPTPPEEERVRAAVKTMLEDGWSRGDTAAFEHMADPVLFHYNGSPRSVTREELTGIVLRWREAFPDLEMRLEELIVEGGVAAARATLSGTHSGEWAGAPPTGERVRMALMLFFRFEDGKVVELWETDDQLGFRRQLGLLPP